METKKNFLINSILESPNDVFIGNDLQHNISEWNVGAKNIFGYDAHEVLGKKIEHLFHKDALLKENELKKRAIEGEFIGRHHARCIKKDGDIIHMSFTICPLRDDNGEVSGTCYIGRDVTVSKDLEEQSQARIRNAEGTLEKMNDGFIMLDKNYCYQYLNKKICEMIGKDAEALIGKNVWDIFPDIVNSVTSKAFIKAMNDKQYIYTLDYYPPLDSWQENHIYPTDQGLSIFIRDISTQKRLEEKMRLSENIYKTIISSIPGLVIGLIDENFRYTLIEGDILGKLGFTKDMLLGKQIKDVLSPERYSEIKFNLERVYQDESFSVTESRTNVDTISRYVPLKNENEEITSAMVVVIDVTELQNANRAITKLNVELENKVEERTLQLADANKELESFSYSVAHDLRTPLRAIGGYATMMLDDYGSSLDGEGRRLLQNIDKNSKKMGILIDELLAFSKLGRKHLQKSLVNMKDIFTSVLTDLQQDLRPEYIIKINDLHEAYVDQSLIKYVVTNLLSNAIKYSRNQPAPYIEISSRLEQDTVQYTIKDNGVGFDMAYADKLFGVFQRMHSNTEFEGTGVGLAIVQRIILRHDGKVWAFSEVGKGATFYFSLPVKTASTNEG